MGRGVCASGLLRAGWQQVPACQSWLFLSFQMLTAGVAREEAPQLGAPPLSALDPGTCSAQPFTAYVHSPLQLGKQLVVFLFSPFF